MWDGSVAEVRCNEGSSWMSKNGNGAKDANPWGYDSIIEVLTADLWRRNKYSPRI